MLTVALVGNPNTGKSTLFNQFTGLEQRVGNYPGVTVERKVGRMKLAQGEAKVVDLPGTYGLYPSSTDERITADILRNPTDPDHPDVVIVVADSGNLKPSLLLLTQVVDLGLPTILALNMTDRLFAEGLSVDSPSLARALGVPVVAIAARTGAGLDELRKSLSTPPELRGPFFRIPQGFIVQVEYLRESLRLATSYAAYQRLLCADTDFPEIQRLLAEAHIAEPKALIANEITVRYDHIQHLLEQAQTQPVTPQERLTERLDRTLLHPVWGYLILALVVLMLFQAVFSWATGPMDAIDGGMAYLGEKFATWLPEGILSRLLIEGIWAGLQGVVVFVPQIALLFLGLAILEESGYLARAGFLMDRLLRPFGLSGRALIPIFGGFACAIPSIMAVRTLSNPRERIITALVIPLMSCSARIPVYTVLIAVLMPPTSLWGIFDLRGLVMAAFYILGILAAMLVAVILKRVLRQPSGNYLSQYIAALPTFKPPRWRNIALQIYQKTQTFVWEAGRVIVVISIILWVLASYGPPSAREELSETYQAARADATTTQVRDSLDLKYHAALLESSYAGTVGRLLEPVIAPLGYDWKMGIALVTSFAAREVFVGTMNTLYSVGEVGEDAAGFGRLANRLQSEVNPRSGEPVFTAAVVLSLLVFYALALQCMSTLAVTARELGIRWAAVLVLYQSALAYLAALLTYQLIGLLG